MLDLEPIKTRMEAATPGPWTESREIFDLRAFRSADEEFIAHARTDVEDLVREVVRLRAEVQRYKNPYGYSVPAKPAPKPIDRDTCQIEGCEEKRPDVPGPPDPKPYVCLKHRHLVKRREWA